MWVDDKTLRTDLLAVNSNAIVLCDGLNEERLAWRPHAGKWSIAENLIHLRITTECFLPTIRHAVADYRRRELFSPGPFRLGWYGRLLVRYVEAPPLVRLPAPRKLVPVLSGDPLRALSEFLDSQAGMLKLLESAAGLNLMAARFPSPLASYIRMNLLEFFSVFNGHSRRHLWQGANVRHRLFGTGKVTPPLST